MTITPDDLRQFFGTEHWYENPYMPGFTYTDGVKYFVDQAGAYWLLAMIGCEFYPKTIGVNPEWSYFLTIDMTVLDAEATIVVADGNDNKFLTRKIEFTDCPDGLWKFYLTNNVLLLPSEY